MHDILFLSKQAQKDIYINKLTSFLHDLVDEYPEHERWIRGAIRQILSGEEREAILLIDKNCNIGAAAIVKRNLTEKKICTFRVAGPCQRQGYGTLLMSICIDYLQTDKPIITVSDTRIEEYKKLFNYYGFKCEQTYYGKYKPTISEYCFNGVLTPETILVPKQSILTMTEINRISDNLNFQYF